MTPPLATATPVGRLKRAAAPVSSVEPELPAVPATVVTTPAGVIILITSLFLSATNMFPLESTARPAGWLNDAADPVPLLLPSAPGVPARKVKVYGVA